MYNPFSGLLPQLSRYKMHFKYVLLTGGLTLLLISAVKCWYKCSQIKFCDKFRQRRQSQYFLKLSSKLPCSLIGMLVNKETDKHFDFFLTALAGGKFSIYVNDAMYPRRQVNDSLTEMPAETDMNVNVHILPVGEKVFVDFEDIRIILFTDPFNLTAYRDAKIVVEVNSLQLLKVGQNEDSSIALDFVFPNGLRAYGLPEHAEKLSLKTTTVDGSEPYRLYNTDRFGHTGNSTDGLYGSIPVLYCPGKYITGGIFWHNAAQTFVDITNNGTGVQSYFMSESGALEAYIFSGPTLKECVKQYANLTGVAPLPQMFALGYHQSRYSYMSQDEILEINRKFEENKIPVDAIWLDIDYTNRKTYFTWNPETFSNPNRMLDYLNGRGRKAVAIIDPHIKREDGYFVFDECESNGYFVKNQNGSSFQAPCWPGVSSWIDFFNPDALYYYSTLISDFAQKENLHIWNDMNEPAVFEAKDQTMDGNCIHYEEWLHRDVHNQYGFYQTMGTYQGLLERGDYKIRPFVLSRSIFAGSQRFTAHWTGDNVASWEHLRLSISMILTESLAGMSLVGADVGGFIGNPTEELLQRWYQLGAWYPFFRAHSDVNTERREPYLFGDEVKLRIKRAIELRYMHLPYWYTLFWEHYKTGEPVIRPLSYKYTQDTNVLDIDDEFLVGDYILVHPVCEEQANHVTVYLPGDEDELWYNIAEFNKTYTAVGFLNLSVTLDSMPIFYKGGGIIPLKAISQSTVSMKDNPVTLLVFLDKWNRAEGTLYSDDELSFDYLENQYCYVKFYFANNTLRNKIIDNDAEYKHKIIVNTVVIHGSDIDTNMVNIERNTTRGNESVDLNTQHHVTKNNETIKIENLHLDVRREFSITINEQYFSG